MKGRPIVLQSISLTADQFSVLDRVLMDRLTAAMTEGERIPGESRDLRAVRESIAMAQARLAEREGRTR